MRRKTPSKKPFRRLALLGLISLAALQLTGCSAKFGFYPPEELSQKLQPQKVQENATLTCSLVRFSLLFPPTTVEKEKVQKEAFALVKCGTCAPFSRQYNWYEKTPSGPNDAAWGEALNAPYRGHPEKITREMMLRDDFRRKETAPEGRPQTSLQQTEPQQKTALTSAKDKTAPSGSGQNGAATPQPGGRAW